MDGVIDQIKQKLDIVEVLGEYIRLVKAGRNWKARCPFHSERTPSFVVSQERQIWHCFGCGTGGDIFEFVKQIEGVEFADALRLLARKAGVVLKRQDPQIQSQKKRLYEICELATKFFTVQLEKSAAGQKAKKYLLERGLKPETIKIWRLGWAPDEWRALSQFLQSRGYSDNEIFQTGLTVKPETSGTETIDHKLKTNYDRFRSRIMFPIFDIMGQVVGFAGRIFGKEDVNVGKYINSPQTALYDKSRLLYGLNYAKMDLRQKNACIFVEGNLDVIMSHQTGVKNAVASSGTALTEEHLKIIKRYTDNLFLAFDADLAGENATRRSIDLAVAQNFNAKVILMKDKDPADVIKKDPAIWVKLIESGRTVMDFYFTSAFAKYNAQESDGRKEIIKVLLPVLKVLPSRTEQSEWVRELARRLRADEKDLMLDIQDLKMPKFADSQTKTSQTAPVLENKTRQEGLEERFLGLCLSQPQHIKNLSGICQQDFQNVKLGQIFYELQNLIDADESKNSMERLQKSLAPELKLQIDYLSLKIQQQPTQELEILSEIETCLKELKILKIRQRLTALSFEINEAQTAGAKKQIGGLLEQFRQLSNELINISRPVLNK